MMESHRVYHDSLNLEKKERSKLRRELLVLIVHELRCEGFFEAVESIVNQATWKVEDSEPCDNIDLALVLADFISYYQVRFDRRPLLTRSKRGELPDSKTEKRTKRALKKQSNKMISEDHLNNQLCLTPNLDVPKSLLINEEIRDLTQVILSDHLKSENKKLDWDDVIGHDQTKRVLEESVICPLKFPEAFASLPKSTGILLFGPPGTGKTHLARVLSSKIQGLAHFLNLKISSFASKWRGESEKLMRILFDLARSNSPCVIFMDEVDAILGDRGSSNEHEASKRSKAEFLIQIDGLQSSGNVFVIAATNLPWSLDRAVLRRFPEQCFVGLPLNENDRHQLIVKSLGNQNVSDKCVSQIVEKANGLSGSDIYNTLVSCQKSHIAQRLLHGSPSLDLGTSILQKIGNRAKQFEAENKFKKWMAI